MYAHVGNCVVIELVSCYLLSKTPKLEFLLKTSKSGYIPARALQYSTFPCMCGSKVGLDWIGSDQVDCSE